MWGSGTLRRRVDSPVSLFPKFLVVCAVADRETRHAQVLRQVIKTYQLLFHLAVLFFSSRLVEVSHHYRPQHSACSYLGDPCALCHTFGKAGRASLYRMFPLLSGGRHPNKDLAQLREWHVLPQVTSGQE